MKTLFTYCVLAVLANIGLSQSVYAQDSSFFKNGANSGDSIRIVIEGDTLKYKKTHSIYFPDYSPEADSLMGTAKKQSDPGLKKTESGLGATGSISRGIQVSSNASVSLQSSMYLKINGSLSENYNVSGTLSEKTSPLQPIGNTRRLNDFDRVMINVTGPALSASVGDIDLHLNQGRFGKLERSIEGIDFYAKSGQISINSSIGFSYGKYHLQQIQGKDGKQGPYRLSGKNGEKFIIVLAGSEKIRIDDQILERGEEDDYIIDYNAAEITFTQKRILSSNSRISIEFEYVPDIYLASYSFGKQLISSGISVGDREQSTFSISAAWRELKDDQRNPLGNIEKDQLQAVFGSLPDSIQTTWVSAITADTVGGDYYLNESDVLIYAGADLGDYRVDFSFVGLEKGEYRKILEAVDSYFVYDTLQGEYLPSRQYFAPKSHSVFSVQSRVASGIVRLDMDFGLSRSIKNLYASDRHNNDKTAWDINLNSAGRYLGLSLGDKRYQEGFATHEALESNEYYRRWQLTPRIEEEEHLASGSLRVGAIDGIHFKGIASQFERSSQLVGEQFQIEAKTAPESPLEMQIQATFTSHDSSTSQQFGIKSAFDIAKIRTKFHLSAEDAVNSIFYSSNDHIKSGIGLNYTFREDNFLSLSYDIRRDYRFTENDKSILNTKNIEFWSDQRSDWASDFSFAGFKNADGHIQLKYREHIGDSNSVTRYYLGNFQFTGKTFHKRIRYREHFIIDEEHVPKYDYHYIEVDTGYGDFSYDPVIQDYISVGGGRFIRQRIFSDIEEQVRKYENKTRIEYSSDGYGESGKAGINVKVSTESRTKLQIEKKTTLEDQNLHSLILTIQTGRQNLLSKLHYSGKSSVNQSTLYNYGSEENLFLTHEVSGTFLWDRKNSTEVGLAYEEKERDIEYNPLAQELWISFRPFAEHTSIISARQKIGLSAKYSRVEDLHLDKIYLERFLAIDHNLRIKKRGRLDQKLSLSNIKADVNGIPYSIFSGRQAGKNWKYSLNTRYTFSSRFQVSMNYSLQKRGTTPTEQYFRMEGRTHF